MTNTPISGYGQAFSDELILGYIAWYTIVDPKVSHQTLSDLYNASGVLDSALVPKAPRLGDAFKRACRYSERSGLAIPYTDNTANILIRSVSTSAAEVERHMVLEIVDPNGKTLEYYTVAEMKFDRVNETMNLKKASIDPDINPIIDSSVELFRAKFKEAVGTIDPQVIRRMIRLQLDAMGGIGVRRQGSVYFYPAKYKAQGEALEELCRNLNSGSVFHNLPLVDDTKQREMIKSAFEEEVHEEATELIKQLMTKAEAGTPITAKAWAEYRKRLQVLSDRRAEYESLVNHEIIKADIELTAFETHLTDMLENGLVKVVEQEEE